MRRVILIDGNHGLEHQRIMGRDGSMDGDGQLEQARGKKYRLRLFGKLNKTCSILLEWKSSNIEKRPWQYFLKR